MEATKVVVLDFAQFEEIEASGRCFFDVEVDDNVAHRCLDQHTHAEMEREKGRK